MYINTCVLLFTATGHNKRHEELLENEKYNFRLLAKTVNTPLLIALFTKHVFNAHRCTCYSTCTVSYCFVHGVD